MGARVCGYFSRIHVYFRKPKGFRERKSLGNTEAELKSVKKCSKSVKKCSEVKGSVVKCSVGKG